MQQHGAAADVDLRYEKERERERENEITDNFVRIDATWTVARCLRLD